MDTPSVYIPAAKEKVTDIVLRLFSRRKEFLKAIAPKGFDRSMLFFMYRPNLYNGYQNYRDRLRHRHRTASKLEPMTLQQFAAAQMKRTYTLADAELESTMIMGAVIALLFDYPHAVFNSQMECYRLGPPDRKPMAEYLHQIMYDHGIVERPYSRFFNVFLCNSSYTPALYYPYRPGRFIFEQLKEAGLDWDFGSFGYQQSERELFGGHEDDTDEDIKEEYFDTDNPIEVALREGKLKYQKNAWRYTRSQKQKLQHLFLCHILGYKAWSCELELKKGFIKAYEKVYGHPPKGYPPQCPEKGSLGPQDARKKKNDIPFDDCCRIRKREHSNGNIS